MLLAGILVELATLPLGLRQTLTVHIAVGVALIPLVLLKLASTALIVVGTHALAHLPKLGRFAFADWARGRRTHGHTLRRALVGFALVTGGSLAVAPAQSAGPWLQAIHHGIGG